MLNYEKKQNVLYSNELSFNYLLNKFANYCLITAIHIYLFNAEHFGGSIYDESQFTAMQINHCDRAHHQKIIVACIICDLKSAHLNLQ